MQTVGQWLDWWMASYLQAKVAGGEFRQSTWDRYERDVRLHLKPQLGHVGLEKLRPIDVEDMLDALALAGLGARGRQTVLRTLSSALTVAERRETVTRNVARLVRGPRVRYRRVQGWSRAEAGAFIAGAQRAPRLLGRLWLVQLGAGLRPGEALALHVEDCDADHGLVRVHRSITWHPGAVFEIGPTKGVDDTWLPLPAFARTALRSALRDTRRGLVFTADDGRPLRQTSIGKPLTRLCERAGVPRVSPHGIRHQTASALLSAGVPLEVVSKILRHSSSRVTSEVYSHLSLDRREEWTAVLDGLTGGAP